MRIFVGASISERYVHLVVGQLEDVFDDWTASGTEA